MKHQLTQTNEIPKRKSSSDSDGTDNCIIIVNCAFSCVPEPSSCLSHNHYPPAARGKGSTSPRS